MSVLELKIFPIVRRTRYITRTTHRPPTSQQMNWTFQWIRGKKSSKRIFSPFAKCLQDFLLPLKISSGAWMSGENFRGSNRESTRRMCVWYRTEKNTRQDTKSWWTKTNWVLFLLLRWTRSTRSDGEKRVDHRLLVDFLSFFFGFNEKKS